MITYRTPDIREAALVAELGRDTFVDSFGHLYSSEDLALFIAQVYQTGIIAAELQDPKLRYLIAEKDGQMIGLCKVGYGVTLDYDPGERHVVELKQLYLHRAAHGSGVGQALMDWAIAQAETDNADEMLLSVYSDNPRAQRFYVRNGFIKISDTYFMVGNHRDPEFLYLKIISKN
jgi:diamine N-acetyltransferase